MAKERAPAFQFYPRDFLTDERVKLMTHTERGIYITLLCMCWLEGSLPAQIPALAQLVHVPRIRFTRLWRGQLSQCFQAIGNGRLGNKRLDQERKKQEAYRLQQSENGSKGGRPKSIPVAANKPTAFNTESEAKAEKSSSSSSSSSVCDLPSADRILKAVG